MATKVSDNISTNASQKDDRDLATVHDQHKCARFPEGRPWWGYVETPANPKDAPNFCTPLQPGDSEDPYNSVWDAPWLPAAKYMKVDARKGRVTIEYGANINDYERHRKEYYDACVETAYEKGWPAPEYGGPVDHKYIAIHGPVPPNPKIPRAALAGDPYVLGFSAQCDDDTLREALAGRNPRPMAVPVRDPAAVPSGPAMLSISEDDLAAKIQAGIEAVLKKQAQDRMAKARAAKKAA